MNRAIMSLPDWLIFSQFVHSLHLHRKRKEQKAKKIDMIKIFINGWQKQAEVRAIIFFRRF